MELVFLALILVLFLLPSILIGRKQRQRQREVLDFQQNLVPGQRVATAGGIIGTVVSTNQNGVDLEVAPNVVITFDRMGILRSADGIGSAEATAVAGQQAPAEDVASEQDSLQDSFGDRNVHPENNPDNFSSGDYGEGDYGNSPESKN